MIKEKIFRAFNKLSLEEKKEELIKYKELREASPLNKNDLQLLEMIIENELIDYEVQCNENGCQITNLNENLTHYNLKESTHKEILLNYIIQTVLLRNKSKLAEQIITKLNIDIDDNDEYVVEPEEENKEKDKKSKDEEAGNITYKKLKHNDFHEFLSRINFSKLKKNPFTKALKAFDDDDNLIKLTTLNGRQILLLYVLYYIVYSDETTFGKQLPKTLKETELYKSIEKHKKNLLTLVKNEKKHFDAYYTIRDKIQYFIAEKDTILKHKELANDINLMKSIEFELKVLLKDLKENYKKFEEFISYDKEFLEIAEIYASGEDDDKIKDLKLPSDEIKDEEESFVRADETNRILIIKEILNCDFNEAEQILTHIKKQLGENTLNKSLEKGFNKDQILDVLEDSWKALNNLKDIEINGTKYKLKEFAKKLFNYKGTGEGKGERFILFVFPYAKISGQSKSFDIDLGSIGKFEVKSYGKCKNIKIGKEGRLTSLTKFNQLSLVINEIYKIFNDKHISEIFKSMIDYNQNCAKNASDQFDTIIKILNSKVKEGDIRVKKSIYTAFRDGEISVSAKKRTEDLFKALTDVIECLKINGYQYMKIIDKKKKDEVYIVSDVKKKGENTLIVTYNSEFNKEKENEAIDALETILRNKHMYKKEFLDSIFDEASKLLSSHFKQHPMIVINDFTGDSKNFITYKKLITDLKIVAFTRGSAAVLPSDADCKTLDEE